MAVRHSIDPEIARKRATIGGYTRRGNLEAAEQARRDLEIHQLEAHLRRIVESAPPLTPEDADKLRRLLPPVTDQPGGGDLDDAA